jgi:hypothetical protein
VIQPSNTVFFLDVIRDVIPEISSPRLVKMFFKGISTHGLEIKDAKTMQTDQRKRSEWH